MTEELFRNDSYLTSCEATVTGVSGQGVVLDRTVFYPVGGGQPGDRGTLTLADGSALEVVDTYKDRETGDHVHVLAEGVSAPKVGDAVTAEIDWERRYRLMRMHTTLHLLCAVVDGGQVGGEKSRLDFDLPDTSLDKEHIEAELNRLIGENHPVGFSSITEDELDAQPELVRTMSVKPPSGRGSVRVIDVDGVDLQPCGGTHVRETGEIGRVRVGKIENKGRHNRRINVHLDDET